MASSREVYRALRRLDYEPWLGPSEADQPEGQETRWNVTIRGERVCVEEDESAPGLWYTYVYWASGDYTDFPGRRSTAAIMRYVDQAHAAVIEDQDG